MENIKRKFEGIWIPSDIWLNKKLTMQEKLFFAEIKSLDNEKGCFASNEYFAEFFGISKTRASIVINSLIKKGFVKSKINYKGGTKQILNRVLNISYIPPITKVKDPPHEKFKDIIKNDNKVDNKTNVKHLFFFDEVLKNENEEYFINLFKTEFEKYLPSEEAQIEAIDFYNTNAAEGWETVSGVKIQYWKPLVKKWVAQIPILRKFELQPV